MAGAAAVVDEVLPQRLTGDGIQHVAVAVVQPDSLCNVDVALQGPGVEQLFVLGQLTQRVGTGNIGGAVQIGGTAVHQQEALALQLGMVLLGGVVVHHGSVSTVGGNGAKALHDEFVLCGAVLVEDLVHSQLGQLFPGSQALFQLLLEPHHGNRIPQMGFAVVGQLDLILHALHGQQGVGLILHGQGSIVLQGLVNGKVHGCRVGQHGLGLGLSGQELEHVIVLLDLHAVGLELCGSFRAQTRGVDEEHRALRGHIAVGHGIGSALDIHGAQVQQPGQIIQLAHQLCGAAQLLELAAQALQLFGRGEACILLGQDPCRGGRQGGAALGPQLILKVQGLDGALLGIQFLLHAAHQPAGSGQAAQAQHAVLRQHLAAVFLHGGHARLTHPHQLDLGTGDLLFGLHKVAAVCPDSALGGGDDEVGVFAVEAGEIGQGGVMVGQVLAGMRVTHRDQINVHAVGLHGSPQGSQTLRNRVHAHNKKPSFFHLSSICRKNVRRRWSLCPIVPSLRAECNSPAAKSPRRGISTQAGAESTVTAHSFLQDLWCTGHG